MEAETRLWHYLRLSHEHHYPPSRPLTATHEPKYDGLVPWPGSWGDRISHWLVVHGFLHGPEGGLYRDFHWSWRRRLG